MGSVFQEWVLEARTAKQNRVGLFTLPSDSATDFMYGEGTLVSCFCQTCMNTTLTEKKTECVSKFMSSYIRTGMVIKIGMR